MEPARTEGQPLHAFEDGTIVSRSKEIPDVSFRAFLSEQTVPRVGWAAPDGLEIVGGGRAAWLTADGAERFEAIRSEADRLFDAIDHYGPEETRPRLIGGFAFDGSREPQGPWSGFPVAGFVLPAVQLTRRDGSTYLTINAIRRETDQEGVANRLGRVASTVADLPTMLPTGEPPGVESTRSRTTRADWISMVEAAVRRIETGKLEKVVLATALDVTLESTIDIPNLLERFRRTYPDCYRLLVQPVEDTGFFGPSPERLVKLQGTTVETEALAGSVPRGETPEEDVTLADSLRESSKLQHEQQLVVEAIRRSLDPLGTVTEGAQSVRKLATIQHLRTPLRADLDERSHIISLVETLHPTPAVGGVPPDLAMDAIRGTEEFDRGWYAAPVGWFDAEGNGEFAVAIRSGIAGGRQATLFAGNGIVRSSDPVEEWNEIHPKYRPILDELE